MAECAWSPWLAIGRYVVMPDHAHFFCSAELKAKTLSTFMQAWKQWTSKRMARELKLSGTIWQEEFFDHVLRSSESYSQKWGLRQGESGASSIG
jgi:putative transposase